MFYKCLILLLTFSLSINLQKTTIASLCLMLLDFEYRTQLRGRLFFKGPVKMAFIHFIALLLHSVRLLLLVKPVQLDYGIGGLATHPLQYSDKSYQAVLHLQAHLMLLFVNSVVMGRPVNFPFQFLRLYLLLLWS